MTESDATTSARHALTPNPSPERRGGRKRTLLLFLLLGAAVNVAVAWGCATYSDMNGREEMGPPFGAASEPSREAFSWVAPQALDLSLTRWPYVGMGVSLVTWQRIAREAQPSVDELRCGFPVLCFKGEHFTGKPDIADYSHGLWGKGTVRGPAHFRPIPVRPLWNGLAINTAFYAAICWLLFGVPFAVRRRRRIKRGLCPACAYPVGASDVCTECGKPVTVRSDEPVT